MSAPKTQPPDFNEEQLEYLADLLRPFCCHTTGSHSPTHFREAPAEFCDLQQSKAWERLVELLGLRERLGAAVSHPKCGWCNDARERARAERDVKGLPRLEDVLRSCARTSGRRNVREREKKREAVAQFGGARFAVSYSWLHKLQEIGDCSWLHLRLPDFDPAAEIPADGYPVEHPGYRGEAAEVFLAVLRDAGATVLSAWGGTEWLSIAIANVTVPAAAAAA